MRGEFVCFDFRLDFLCEVQTKSLVSYYPDIPRGIGPGVQ